MTEALTHRSYLNEYPKWRLPHNERLEYLGDAVLELAVTESLFKKYADAPEGRMTVLRAALVNYQALSKSARSLGVEEFLLMSKGEARDTGESEVLSLCSQVERI